MKFSRIDFEDLGVRAEYSQFSVPNGVAEWHVMLHVEPKTDLFIGQMQRIYAAEDRLPGLPASQERAM